MEEDLREDLDKSGKEYSVHSDRRRNKMEDERFPKKAWLARQGNIPRDPQKPGNRVLGMNLEEKE
jgi:hypothetical protein